jgi:F-type H+-transporting ATPase subunit gamma
VANLKEIRQRIRSVKSTQQITKAMKMIAAARLRKAQEAIVAKRPYAHRIRDIIASLATRTDANDHPLLAKRTPKKVLLLILTSDRGMCGGFNVNTARATVKYITQNEETHESIELAIIGKKGLEYFRRRPQYAISKEYRGILENIDYEKAKTVGDEVIASYTDEGLDAVLMVYNEFKSAMTQQVIVEQLLPVVPEETLEDDVAATMLDFEYEPSKADVLDEVLPLHVNTQIYRAILESIASEMGARMTAMDAATRNAQELISKLTLKYNRARQAAITTELMEIIGGAEALKG